MANDGHCGAACLCECDKVKAAATKLRDASRNGVNITAVSKLDGIEHKQIGGNASCFFHNDREIRFS